MRNDAGLRPPPGSALVGDERQTLSALGPLKSWGSQPSPNPNLRVRAIGGWELIVFMHRAHMGSPLPKSGTAQIHRLKMVHNISGEWHQTKMAQMHTWMAKKVPNQRHNTPTAPKGPCGNKCSKNTKFSTNHMTTYLHFDTTLPYLRIWKLDKSQAHTWHAVRRSGVTPPLLQICA